MVHLVVCLAALLAVASAGVPSLHSAAVKGHLLCGNKNVDDAYVRLLRVPLEGKKVKDADILKETLDQRQTSGGGLFDVTGNTNGRALNETSITPAIAIYHKCDLKADSKVWRRVLIKAPQKVVSPVRIPRTTHDIGTLNLEITFPGEVTDKEFTPDAKPLVAADSTAQPSAASASAKPPAATVASPGPASTTPKAVAWVAE